MRKELPNAVVFWGIPKGDAEDLGVREAELSNEDELRAILASPDSSVRIFSRRPESVKALWEGISDSEGLSDSGSAISEADKDGFVRKEGERTGLTPNRVEVAATSSVPLPSNPVRSEALA